MKNTPSQSGTNVTDAQWMQWADDEVAMPAANDGNGGGGAPAPRGAVVKRVVGEVGHVVRVHYDAISDKHDDDVAALWANIAGEIATASPSSSALAPTASPSSSWWRYALTGVASAALASLVTFALSRQGAAPSVATSPVGMPLGTQAAETQLVAVPVDPTHAAMLVPAMYRQPPTVETLDVAAGSGTIITVEDPEGNAAIIWVTPNDLGELQ